MLGFSYVLGNSLIGSDELKNKNTQQNNNNCSTTIIKTATGKQQLWELFSPNCEVLIKLEATGGRILVGSVRQ